MARIWMEGFEHGIPNSRYLPGGKGYQWETDTLLDKTEVGQGYFLTDGRPPNSKYCLRMERIFATSYYYTKYIEETAELYLRAYMNNTGTHGGATAGSGNLFLSDNTGNTKISITFRNNNKVSLYVRIGGTYTLIDTYDFQYEEWKKVDIYYKAGTSDGAYELRIDNVPVASASSVNTGSTLISIITFGKGGIAAGGISFDDMAVNNTVDDGSGNYSWCGDGQIVGLLPKADGASTDWTPEGYTIAESGTNTTTLKITTHGLSDNDVIYNVTRDAYRIVTVSDVNTLTMAAITGQAEGDIIMAYDYADTITAGAGTSTSLVNILGHNLESGDVIVNTTRSNAIRRVLYTVGQSVYNSDTALVVVADRGATVTSQASGDSIKTFKVHFYPFTNWKACANERPNPQFSRIKSNTSDHKAMFDMEELVADKAIASTSNIRAVSLSLYSGDIGTGGSEIKPILKSGVTEYEGETIALPAITRINNVVYSRSPFTNTKWIRSEVDGLETGVKVV